MISRAQTTQNTLKAVLGLMVFCCLGFYSWADDEYERSVNLEWGAVEGATGYQIRLTKKSDGKKKKPKTYPPVADPKWEATVNYGRYDLQLRSFDDRNVPGEWSPAMEFVVRPLTPKAIAPRVGSKIKAKDEDEANVKLSWNSVKGASRYKVSIADASNKFSQVEYTSKTSYTFELPVAKRYLWSVIAIMEDGLQGEGLEKPYHFKHIGPQIAKPVIDKPASKFVQELEWEKPDHAQSFNYALYRKLKKTGKWRLIEAKKGIQTSQIPFKISNPTGEYKLKVQARAKNRKTSALATETFKVQGGFRSPAALEKAVLKDSLNKPTNFYAIASYFVSQVNYESVKYENEQASAFQVLGGTGRLGIGYQDPESSWGGFFVADYGGINIAGENYTFASMELHGTYKIPTSFAGVLLLDAGIYSKELPEIVGSDSLGVQEVNVGQNMGPHLGFKYWMPLNKKLGFQVNGRVYYSMLGTAPNGQEIVPTISYQVGVLGSLKLRRNLMGFAGLAQRIDQSEYLADTEADGSQANEEGLVNSIQLQGTYLNLILEYSF